MDVFGALALVVLGILLGAVGQGARAIVGLKKKYDKAPTGWFDRGRLLISLLIGGTAGALGAVFMYGTEISGQTLAALVGIGYAGTDFIEGFMKKG